MATNHEVRGSNPLRCEIYMFIKTFTSGPADTNCYLVGCPKTREALIIDAPQGVTSKITQEDKWVIKMIFITHSHWDHTVDAAQLKKTFRIPLYIHPSDEENLRQPGSDKLPLFFPIDSVQADGFLKDGEIFRVGNLEFKIIETPGHSPGGVCLWFQKEKVLFSGDTLFRGAIGRTDFPTSSPSQMRESLNKLAKLPPDTKVYSGHGLPTTIAAESQNIFGG
jgi:hydroxyacylglutathione hydrolase